MFIDPRGYFGRSKILGIKEYDLAKILYGISGYDTFNNNNNFLFSEINIAEKSLHFTIQHFLDNPHLDKYFNTVHYAFMVIIWLNFK